MYTFNKPSGLSLNLKCADVIMHTFRVRYFCLITALYHDGFFTFLVVANSVILHEIRMNEDDKRRLAKIV